jgi:hypothetical protein
LETSARLLNLLEAISADDSKYALNLLNNQAGFDSAIRRFDPSRPSQLEIACLNRLFRRFIWDAQSAA